MKVTVSGDYTKDPDGVDSKVTYEHHNIETVEDLAWVFSEAARALGFTYVSQVGLIADNDKEYWSVA